MTLRMVNQRNILFIAPTRIGDAVLSTSILRHIALSEPDAKVTIVTSPLAAPLFEGYPQLARIIPITKRSFNRHWLMVWRACIGTKWGAVWDMRGSVVSYLLRIRTRHVYVPPKTIAPKVKQYEAAFGVSGLPFPILWPRAGDTAFAERTVANDTRYLVLAPIANWTPKQWPMEKFIALATQLLSGPYVGYRPIIICAGAEREQARPLLNALRDHEPIDLTTGDAPLLSVYAVMQRAHGFIGNDSGLMHMAAAASIPTLGLFGPTPHEIYQPWGERAAFLTAPEGDLSQLSVDAVSDAFQTLMRGNEMPALKKEIA